jgi:hypothetical protein
MSDEDLLQRIAALEAQLAKKQRKPRVKPVIQPYAELKKQLPMDVRAAWSAFETMTACKRRNGEVSESVIATLLQQVMAKCNGMPAAAIAHGLLEATKANADNYSYVYKAALSYTSRRDDYPTPMPTPKPVPKPVPQSNEDYAAFLEANPEMGDMPTPEQVEHVKAVMATGGVRALLRPLMAGSKAVKQDIEHEVKE